MNLLRQNIISSRFILTVLACMVCCYTHANEQSNFIHLNVEINQQHTNITHAIEDAKGYLWLHFQTGLLRFDGYDYKPYSFQDIFGNNASVSSVLGLSKNSNQQVWCVSQKGAIATLSPSGKFTPKYGDIFDLQAGQKIESMTVNSKRLWLGSNFGRLTGQSLSDSTTITFDMHSPNETITSISESKNGIVWFSTSKGRIFKGNIHTNKLQELKGAFNNPFNAITIVNDDYGNLWIGTELYGLFVYDVATKTFEHFHNKAKTSHFIPANMIIRLFSDSKGLIWAGTDGGGLYQIDPDTKQIKTYTHSKTNQFSLQSNSVIGISETNNKDIWVFTNYGNINVLPHESNAVNYISGGISGSPTRILSILKAKDGQLWLGTDGEGLTLVNKNGHTEKQYIANTKTARGLPGNYIQAIAEDKNGNLWIGTYLNGLAIYNKKKDRFTPIKIVNQLGQSGTDIRSIYVDKKNRVWAGSNIGIVVYNEKQQQIAFFPHNKNLKGNIAEFFTEDELGQFWIGMFGGGLYLVNENTHFKKSTFTKHSLAPHAENSLRHGCSNQSGYLFVIDSNSKLIQFDIHKKQAVPFEGFSKEQLHNNAAIVAFDPFNIWLSKNNGISHLNLQSKEEFFYTWKNGTIRGKYLSGSTFSDTEGVIYFGGIEGINYFNPNNMQTQKKDLNLYINDMEIVNRDAREIIPNQLESGIEQTHHLQLNHNQTSFSFGFSVVNDHLDPNYVYAYRLKGFNDNWITNNNRVATYTNIPYGDYTFEVKAGTKLNDWNIPPKSVNITVLPPLWKRWWAYAIYGFLLCVISFFIVRYYLIWIGLKQKLLLEEMQNEKNKELYAMKMNFFAKMSHEIQTPLTLILSPIDNMIERAEGNLLLSQRLQVIKNNATRLSRIAMELMTIRNKEMGKLKIRANENNVVNHLNQVALSFMEHARFKNIDLIFESEPKGIMLWYDQQKLEHIIYNLLANAFKFTPRDGKITMQIKEDISSNKLYIKVADTGMGIPKYDLENIFNLFYQSKGGKGIEGTGIGLALTKELILLHKGKIKVESEINKGSIFTISLPLGNSHFGKEEIVDADSVQNKKTEATPIVAEAKEETLNITDETKKTLMVVEDNYEMLMFLEDSFKSHYNVIVAQNGQEALDKVIDVQPDIILSDVMMPIMDGITFCKRLKEKRSMRHIPIIFLTTKNAIASKLEGLQFGAIEYINKPFNVKELLLKVNNILEAQQSLIEQYRAEILTKSKEIEIKSPDEKFIESVIVELEKNFDNSHFRLQDLSKPLNMSYTNIYKRFQALTDKKLVDFMRSYRLKKALPLLVNYNIPIAEVAFRTGFSDPKYFSKCFKKEYDISPVQYRQQHRLKSNKVVEK